MENSITNSFLEQALRLKVRSFSVEPGLNFGDNHTTNLHSIKVEAEDENKESIYLYLIIKSYPANPVRQKFLKQANLFFKELEVYTKIIPELSDFGLKKLEKNGNKDKFKKFAFPPLVDCRAIDYSAKENLIDENHDENGLMSNYLLMTDIRKTWGFKMSNRLQGLNNAHCRLVMLELAKFHSFSWAYKVKNELRSLSDKFTLIGDTIFCQNQMPLISMLVSRGFDLMEKIIKLEYGKDSEILTGLKRYKSNAPEFMMKYIHSENELTGADLEKIMRLSENSSDDEIKRPWKVLCHGDCWTNNLLFKYDAGDCENDAPLEIVFVDFQLVKEASPLIDLAYFFYTSTTRELRKNFLNELLEIYFNEFIRYCKLFNVDPLPGFTLNELVSRFHNFKPYGLIMSTIALPLMLYNSEDTVHSNQVEKTKDDSVEDGKNLKNIEEQKFTDVVASKINEENLLKKDSPLSMRFIEIATELYEQGVL